MTDAAGLSDCVGAFAAEVDVVHRALRRFGVGPHEAEDLAQEVFVVMCRRWADYDPRRPLRPWLVGIAFRVARAHRRRPSRELAGGLIDFEDESANPDRRLAAGRARALVRAALGALSEKQRAVMILHDLDGVAMQEIAGALSAPLTTLYSRLHKARRSFARAVRRLERRYALVPGGASLESLLQLERAPDPWSATARLRLLDRTGGGQGGSMAPASGSPGSAGLGTRGSGQRGAIGSASRSAESGGLGTRAPGQSGAIGLASRSAGSAGRAAGRSGRSSGKGPSFFARTLELGGAALLVAAVMVIFSQRPSSDARAAVARDLGDVSSGRPPRVGPPRLAPAPPELKASGAAPPATDSLAQGLIGYWRFDDGAASPAARDLSGHGTDCLPRGTPVDWTAGRFGGAVRLGGTGWLECPDPRFGGGPDLTVAAWIKRPRAQRGMRVIAARQLGSGARDHFFFGLAGDELTVASHVWNGPLRHPLPPAGDRWVHVAAVHRDGQVTLFIDGVPVESRRSYRGRRVDASGPILIGAGVNGPDSSVTTQRFAGAIDELAVYDRPLGADEIAALAAGEQPPLSR